MGVLEAAYPAREESQDGHPQRHEQHFEAGQGDPSTGPTGRGQVHAAQSYGGEDKPPWPAGDACTF